MLKKIAVLGLVAVFAAPAVVIEEVQAGPPAKIKMGGKLRVNARKPGKRVRLNANSGAVIKKKRNGKVKARGAANARLVVVENNKKQKKKTVIKAKVRAKDRDLASVGNEKVMIKAKAKQKVKKKKQKRKR